MARALEVLDRLLRWRCIALMGLMSAFVIASVILRYSFNLTYTWAEEAITMLFVAITYFGSAPATYRDEHISMNWFDDCGGPIFRRFRTGAASCVVIAVSAVRAAQHRMDLDRGKRPVSGASLADVGLLLNVPALLRTDHSLRTGPARGGSFGPQRRPRMSALILFGLFVVFLALGVPIGLSLGASSLAYLFYADPDRIGMIPQRIWAGTNTSAIGSVLIPEMEEKGYPRRFAAGVTVAASTMGMIIPPSIPMLTYAMISGGSMAALFLAGLVPGVMIGVLQIGVSLFLSRRKGYLEKAHSLRRKTSLLGGIPALVTPLIIVGSVTSGVATASESAGVAVFYALLVGSLVYRELDWKLLPSILLRTASASASVMLVIGLSMISSAGSWRSSRSPQRSRYFFGRSS